jgi:hypothetical protein
MCPKYITKILLVKSKHKLSDLTHLTFALTPKGSHQNKFQSKTKKQKNGSIVQKKSPGAMFSYQLLQIHHGYITKHQKSHLHVKEFNYYDMQKNQHKVVSLKVY